MKREDIRDLLVTPAIVVALTLILYRCIQKWLSINDNYEAATLTSSLLMAIVTAIYVRYTYRIFDVTNKNTEQNANAQKIAYLERQLELFYMPMQSALKEFGRNETIKTLTEQLQDEDTKRDASKDANDKTLMRKCLLPIAEKWWDFKDEHCKIDPYTHLASGEVTKLLREFTDLFNDFPRRYDSRYETTKLGEQYPEYSMDYLINLGGMRRYIQNSQHLFECLEALESALDADIASIKLKLAELVNL